MRLLDPRLKAFLNISRLGTVLGAGKSLGLTQTAVTQRIRSLEAELGVTLFTRSRKGMRLTSEGQALLQYCKGAVELEGAVFSKLSGDMASAEIHLTVAGPTSIMTTRIASAAAAMLKSNPNLYLHLLIDDDSNLVDLVRMDRAQLAAVSPTQVPLEVDSKRLKPDRYLLVGPACWRRRQLAEILAVERIIDFYESDKITLNYLRKFDLEKHLKRSRLFVNDNGALIKLFTEGVGFGTLEQNVAKPFLDSGKLITLNKGQFLEDQVALIWYPRPQMPTYFGEFISAIK